MRIATALLLLYCIAMESASKFDEALAAAVIQLGFKRSLVLKQEQRAAVQSVYDGKDVFLWLPTGFGKSLCYELLPFLFDNKLGRQPGSSLVIVISPLISLMVDQVVSLRSRGVKAAIVTGGDGVRAEFIASEDDLKSASLLYCAPEAILGSRWRGEIEASPVSSRVVAVVVDEAHCVSKW